MEDSPESRPFLKLKLTSGKPAEGAEGVPSESCPADVPAKKSSATPFVSPPPGLSPSASRTAPVPRPAKPPAPAPGTTAGAVPPPAPGGSSSPPVFLKSPPVVSAKTERPDSTPADDSPATGAVRNLRLQGRAEAVEAKPAPVREQVPATGGVVVPPVFPSEPAVSESPSASSAVRPPVARAATAPAAAAPATSSAPDNAARSGVASTTIPTRAPALRRMVLAGGAAAIVLTAVVVLALGGTSGPSVAKPVEQRILPAELITSGAAVPEESATAPEAASAPASVPEVEPVSGVRAKSRDEALSRWLAESRVTSISSDRITMNRRFFAMGAPVNPEGTLKWVGRDSVSGNLLFVDGAGVVYEKSPR